MTKFMILLALAIALQSDGMTAPMTTDNILFRPSKTVTIRGGKFGDLQKFQIRLAEAASKCGYPVAESEKFADGAVGRKTAEAIKIVSRCELYASKIASDDPSHQGYISKELWSAVAPEVNIPDARERAAIMSGANEGTDYTVVVFNVGTKDSGIITWGPKGAAAGHAHAVQKILKAVDKQIPDAIDVAFASESYAVRSLMVTENDSRASALVHAVSADRARKNLWIRGFSALGAEPEVRAIYDKEAKRPMSSGITEAVADFFRSYWSHCWSPTEVDAAFFLDRAVQMNIRQSFTNAAATSVASAEERLGRKFDPAERRRAIAANFQGTDMNFVGDRLARDVAFYVDMLRGTTLNDETLWALRTGKPSPPAQLNDELSKWKIRSGVSALDYGLIDERAAPVPEGLTPPECASAITAAQ